MKRPLWLLAVAAVAATSQASYAQNPALPKEIVDVGILRVAADTNYPPMYFKNDAGITTGIGTEVLQGVAKRLGVNLEIIDTSYAQLLPGLETKRFDFIGGSMVDFPDRRQSLTFADFIKTGPQVFTLQKDGSPTKDEDLCGKTVAHARFVASYGAALQDFSKNICEGRGLPPVSIKTDDLPAQIALSQGRYDAGAVTAESVAYLMKTEPDQYRKVGEPLRSWRYGFAFQKDDTKLRDAVSGAVQAMIDDGSYGEILKSYGVAAQAIESATIDGGQF